MQRLEIVILDPENPEGSTLIEDSAAYFEFAWRNHLGVDWLNVTGYDSEGGAVSEHYLRQAHVQRASARAATDAAKPLSEASPQSS